MLRPDPFISPGLSPSGTTLGFIINCASDFVFESNTFAPLNHLCYLTYYKYSVGSKRFN